MIVGLSCFIVIKSVNILVIQEDDQGIHWMLTNLFLSAIYIKLYRHREHFRVCYSALSIAKYWVTPYMNEALPIDQLYLSIIYVSILKAYKKNHEIFSAPGQNINPS